MCTPRGLKWGVHLVWGLPLFPDVAGVDPLVPGLDDERDAAVNRHFVSWPGPGWRPILMPCKWGVADTKGMSNGPLEKSENERTQMAQANWNFILNSNSNSNSKLKLGNKKLGIPTHSNR